MSNSNWKWSQSAQNAFNLVAQAFDFSADTVRSVKNEDVTRQLKAADESDIQVKRIQDYIGATKKRWRNSLKVNGLIHGAVRTALKVLGQKQAQEALTTKEYAKHVTGTRVLSAKTQTAVQKTYLRGAKQIEKTGNDLQRFQGELDEQHQITEQTANQQSQQRRVSYRSQVQKRLTTNSKPWRNY